MADRDLIPDGNLVEIRYEDLETDLVAGVANMYKTFGWDGCVSPPPAPSAMATLVIYDPRPVPG